MDKHMLEKEMKAKMKEMEKAKMMDKKRMKMRKDAEKAMQMMK